MPFSSIWWSLFLMPLIRSSASKHHAHLVLTILLFGEIMPSCSCCSKMGLVCVVIASPSGHQPSSYTECTRVNICSSCNIRSVSDSECTHPVRLWSLLLFCLICRKAFILFCCLTWCRVKNSVSRGKIWWWIVVCVCWLWEALLGVSLHYGCPECRLYEGLVSDLGLCKGSFKGALFYWVKSL